MSSHNVSHLLRFFCISLLFASCNLYQSVDEVDSDEPQVDATFDVTSDAGSDQSEADVATIDMPSSDVPPDMTEQRWMPPGPTYFVATDGDDSNDGSIDAPWQTFAFATSNLVANDTLFIRGGDYTEQLNINVIGFPDEPIHIRAYEDEAVVIHEIDTPLLIQNTRSVHLYGITLGDAFINWGLIDDSNNVILENVTAMVTRPTPAATTSHEGFTIESSDFVTLRNVNFAGWGFRDDASRDGHNLTISQCD